MGGKYRFIPELSAQELADKQLEGLKWTVAHTAANSPFYKAQYKDQGVEFGDIKSLDDLQKLPFTTADHLKEGYPLPLLSVPEEDVVRIHGSSGTTGSARFFLHPQGH